ncbi:hypothetical protein [Streptomyces spectabilis]|uniref:GNAT superfamily N-acetyltransferase n=1 Tax=Streptomyces spectabilis TaxID=68270 RepID=A0A5P2X884_STRST|nr:hypothetical protein [Streptomyces spectabilis]MBB5103665.1 GNAT superfamily N-acetyltransferase [Streptomyces spectabilis]MCI3904090.1 hypothetical protein [Streptomyces spectabilis]QEV61223.1 hypothetical protein CP982_23035 [Streptomyces spectabilis]GGV19469.1 hypothetical protein GCM10010245_33000 [Streptomyces spectabilis]
MAEVFLRRLSRWQAEQQREDVATVYTACHEQTPHQEQVHDRDVSRGQGAYRIRGQERAEFLARFERHVQERDFDMVAADSATGLVGCLYGYRAAPDTPDLTALRDVLPPAATGAAAAGRLFLLVELMVLPEHRRRRVATRLRDLLLARHGTDVVVTTPTAVAGDGAAHEVLRAWSCTKLGEFGTPPREAWLHPA